MPRTPNINRAFAGAQAAAREQVGRQQGLVQPPAGRVAKSWTGAVGGLVGRRREEGPEEGSCAEAGPPPEEVLESEGKALLSQRFPLFQPPRAVIQRKVFLIEV